ncbi:co-chaperone YbbN [Rhodococcus sp. NPDC058514]|uniref:co-chaperone YbbN n=1 Tax=unclassified Rhodococcus (in: high G+C Gram-positive bacteria) TaxID=192944 RepID=UPI0036553FD1
MSGAVDLSVLKERAQAAPAGPPTANGASATLAPVVEVTEASFEAEVLTRSTQVPVVVELFAASMPSTAVFSATLDSLAAAGNGSWVLARVNVDADPRIAQAFGVQALPAVVAVAGGRPLADFDGDEPQLGQWIDAVLQATDGKLSGPPAAADEAEQEEVEDPRFVAAENALSEGDLAGAEAAYQAILDAEPANAQALGAVRQVRFIARVQDIAPDAVARADADPTDVSAQLDAADSELYGQQPEAAFARLVETIRRTAGDERTVARTRLLELFELFDPADPIVIAARRKLASALY